MFKFRKQMLMGFTAFSIATAGLTAYAMPDRTPTPEQQAKFAAKMTEHFTKLHDNLNISAAQESAWQTFIGKIKPVAPANRPPHMSKEALAKLNAPELLDHRMERLKQAETRLSTYIAAVKELYTVLTPEQQKIFDQHLHRMERHRFHHGME